MNKWILGTVIGLVTLIVSAFIFGIWCLFRSGDDDEDYWY